MRRSLPAFVVLMLMVATGAQAQVYRCSGKPVYTDKPCKGAAPVDVRSNLLDAGPRGFPPPPVPAPAVILPDTRQQPSVGTTPGSAWSGHDAREAEFRRRTGPF